MSKLILLNDMLLEYLPSHAVENPIISNKYNIEYNVSGMGITARFTGHNLRKSIGLVKLNKAAGYYVNIESWENNDKILNKKMILKDILTDIDINFHNTNELQIKRNDVMQVINIIKNKYENKHINYRVNLFLTRRNDIMKELRDYKIFDYRKIKSYSSCLCVF